MILVERMLVEMRRLLYTPELPLLVVVLILEVGVIGYLEVGVSGVVLIGLCLIVARVILFMLIGCSTVSNWCYSWI